MKKSRFPGFIYKNLKWTSDLFATWNGGAPNARVKKITPREKISAK